MDKREDFEKKIADIFKRHEIEMNIEGCGCCGSPSVRFKYKGEELYCEDTDKYGLTDNINLTMIKD